MLELSISYSRKIWQFGGMPFNHQIKFHQIFFCVHVCVAILHYTAKLPVVLKTSFGAKPPNLMTTK